MARSLRKGPYVDLKLIKKVRKLEESEKTPLLRPGRVDQ